VFGGAAFNTFTGSVTWDSGASTTSEVPSFATYPISSATFMLNSTDLTAGLSLHQIFISNGTTTNSILVGVFRRSFF